MESIPETIVAIQALLEKKIGLKKQGIISLEQWKEVIEKRKRSLHIDDEQEYYELLLRSPEEIQQFIELIVIPETWFFRDKEIYKYLIDWIYKRKEKKANGRDLIHILSIPCSSGEEPYSIAIALNEAKISSDLYKIEGLDISAIAVDRAQKGIFNSNSFRGEFLEFLGRYFDRDDKMSLYKIKKTIRDRVVFMSGNIFDPQCIASLGLYDIIFCRNLLIYLTSTAQKELLRILRKHLKPKGVLFVSPAEIQIAKREKFFPIQKDKLFILTTRECQPPPKLKNIRSKQKPYPSSVNIEKQKNILQEALSFADKGLYEKSQKICTEYIQEHGENEEANFLLGCIEHARNNLNFAELYFLKTIAINPNHYEALIYLALISESLGKTRQGLLFRFKAKQADKIGNRGSS
jgi:chemotaxis protein methyltransferase WspC